MFHNVLETFHFTLDAKIFVICASELVSSDMIQRGTSRTLRDIEDRLSDYAYIYTKQRRYRDQDLLAQYE